MGWLEPVLQWGVKSISSGKEEEQEKAEEQENKEEDIKFIWVMKCLWKWGKRNDTC